MKSQDTVVASFRPPNIIRHQQEVKCALHAQFPSRNVLRISNQLVVIEGAPEKAPPTAKIVFHSLLAQPNDHKDYPTYWKAAPRRGTFLGALEVSLGANATTPEFDCSLSRPFTGNKVWVLMECQGTGCRVEYRELAEESKTGQLFMSRI
jgi:hypothetical protein